MNVCVFTRSKTITCNTLNTLLRISAEALQHDKQVFIHYITQRSEINKYLKDTNNALFVMEYGTNLDFDHINYLFKPLNKQYPVVVFPTVNDTIDWDIFVKKTLSHSKEPVEQRGLSFDTIPGKKIDDVLNEVEKTEAKTWLVDTKQLKKTLGTCPQILSTSKEFFDSLMSRGCKIAAFMDSNSVMNYVYECRANIKESAYITVT